MKVPTNTTSHVAAVAHQKTRTTLMHMSRVWALFAVYCVCAGGWGFRALLAQLHFRPHCKPPKYSHPGYSEPPSGCVPEEATLRFFEKGGLPSKLQEGVSIYPAKALQKAPEFFESAAQDSDARCYPDFLQAGLVEKEQLILCMVWSLE